MKKSGGKKINNALDYKNVVLVLLAFITFVFCAITGVKYERLSRVGKQNVLDANDRIGEKTKTENPDGTTTISLTVKGDSAKKFSKVNVIVIVDRSGSMDDDAGYDDDTFTEGTSNSAEYGKIDNNYIHLYHLSGKYAKFSGTPGTGSYYGWFSNEFIRIYYNNGTWYRTRNQGWGGTTYSNPYDGDVYTRSDQYTNYWYTPTGVQYTGTRYTRTKNGETRMAATKEAVTTLSNALLENNGKNGNPNDVVEMALVTFATSANTNISKTTDKTVFANGVNNITVATGNAAGTNWEAALKQANNINFGDSDPTFVIFFTDGAPTLYGNSNGSGYEEEPNMETAYNNARDDAKTLATKVTKDNFYTIFAFGEVYGANYLNRLTTAEDAAGASADNNYSADNTTALQEAFADILSKISTVGIGSVSIADGTTNNIASGVPALLEIVPNSFKYWKTDPNKNNGERTEWTSADNPEPPEAINDNGTIRWNLSDLGILEDDVIYEVTFDVYPSQYTYDLIAELTNDPSQWENVSDSIKEYLHKNGDSYSLDTNTTATIKYKNTKLDPTDPDYNKELTYIYDNPQPVSTNVSKIDVEKVWLNQFDKEFSPENIEIVMDLIRDSKNTGKTITLNNGNDWKYSRSIATGLMRTYTENGKTKIELLDSGHDYTLTEPEINNDDFKSYQWELQIETVHPMIINGILTTLIEVPTNEIPSGMGTEEVYTFNGHTFYRFNGKVYYDKVIPQEGEQQTNAELKAYNIRRSNFNFTKKVIGDVVGDELFEFTFKVNDLNIDESKISSVTAANGKTREEIIRDEYSIWFSVCDPAKLPDGHKCDDPDTDTFKISDYLEKNLITTAHKEIKDGKETGYYYYDDNSNINVSIEAGWNVRVTNIGTGSDYFIKEIGPNSPFTLSDIDGKLIVSVPELPANALPVEGSEGVFEANGIRYTRVEKQDAAGITRVSYEYEYEPTKDIDNGTISGVVLAPNNSFAVTFTNIYPKTHLDVEKVWESPAKTVKVDLWKSINGGEPEKTDKTLELNEANDFKDSFRDLDAYDEDGNVYNYFSKEQDLNGSFVTKYAGFENIELTATVEEDGILEVSTTVTVGDNEYDVTIKKSNGWKYVIENVPYLDEEGNLLELNINPDDNITYALTNRKNTITNKEVVNISGEKTWNDGDNQDGLRPESITVTLTATIKALNEETGEEEDKVIHTYNKIVTEDDEWSWDWESLPKYEDDKLIIYTLTETKVSGYEDPIVNGYNVENKHQPSTVDVSGEKTWNDGPDGIDQDGVRPESIEVTLVGKVETLDEEGNVILDENNKPTYRQVSSDTKTITPDKDGKWSWSWEDLPEFNNGQKIIYEVVETPIPEYESKVTGYNITNTHELQTVDVTGSKTWDDQEDEDGNTQDGVRPSFINITLTGKVPKLDDEGHSVLDEDGKPTYDIISTDTKKVTADDNWSWEWLKLPKNYKGQEIIYEISEGEVSYYTPQYNGYSIINHHNPFKTSLVVVKHWEDGDNQDGIRPSSVHFILKADGVAITDVITLSEDNDWTYTNNNLPRRAAGTDINYTITEIAVDGYGQTKNDVNVVNETTQDKTIQIDVENSHTPEEVTVAGSKDWQDDGDRDKLRPESITITLKGKVKILDEEGKPVLDEEGNFTYTYIEPLDGITKTIYPDANGKWTWDFGKLPKFYQGKEITYDIIETPVAGYEAVQSGYDLINSHGIAKTSVSGIKKWDDDGDREGNRPNSVTITLYANGEPVDTAVASIESNWMFSFPDLPLNEDGVQINYTVGEDEEAGDVPTGYTSEVKPTAQENYYEVWNHYIEYETTEITVKKNWNDDNDREGLRPTTIYVNVYDRDDMTTPVREHVPVTGTIDNPNWSYTIDGLPKYKYRRQEVHYVVNEVEVSDDYSSNVLSDGLTITNTINKIEKVTVPVTKTWIDGGDKYGYRIPVTVKLVKVNADDSYTDTGYTAELNKDNNWSYTFGVSEDEDLPMHENHGNTITYKVIEVTQIPQYEEPSYPADGVIVNQIKNLEKVIPITKVWEDNYNQDGKRPTSITIDLVGTIPGDEEGTFKLAHSDTMTLTGGMTDREWYAEFTGAPIFFEGTEVTYTVTETLASNASDYPDSSVEADGDGFKFTNKHELIKVPVSVKKVWDDADNNDGKRPTSITISLTGKVVALDEEGNPILDGEGNKTYNTVSTETVTISPFESEDESIKLATIDSYGNWTYSFGNMPAYNAGSEIIYEVAEVGEYDKYELLGVDGYTITNQHLPETISYKVTKHWDDFDDQDGVRPDSITVYLTPSIKVVDEEGNVSYEPIEGVEPYSQTITENEDGDWIYTFTGLPKYNNGRLVHYILTEAGVDLYVPKEIAVVETEETTGNGEDGLSNEIDNHHDRLPHDDITVYKYWDDEEDKYKKRPNSITVRLLANGEVIQTGELNAANGWKYTFTDLWYYYKDGIEAKYSVDELDVEYYESTVNGFEITNKYNGPIPEITPPKTGVKMVKATRNNNIMIKMILTLLTTSYTVVVRRKRNN